MRQHGVIAARGSRSGPSLLQKPLERQGGRSRRNSHGVCVRALGVKQGMGRWSARYYAWARSDERAIRGPRSLSIATHRIDCCGLALPLRCRCRIGARARDSTSTQEPHAGAAARSRRSMPRCLMINAPGSAAPGCQFASSGFRPPGTCQQVGFSGYAGTGFVDVWLHLLIFPKTARFRSCRPLRRVHVA